MGECASICQNREPNEEEGKDNRNKQQLPINDLSQLKIPKKSSLDKSRVKANHLNKSVKFKLEGDN